MSENHISLIHRFRSCGAEYAVQTAWFSLGLWTALVVNDLLKLMVNRVLRFKVNPVLISKVNLCLSLMVNSLLRFVVNTRLNDSPLQFKRIKMSLKPNFLSLSLKPKTSIFWGLLGLGSLALTGCGPKYHTAHSSGGINCLLQAAAPACGYGGVAGYNQAGYYGAQTAGYQGGYYTAPQYQIPQYPQTGVSYVQAAQPHISYMQTVAEPAPIVAPTPVSIPSFPAPIEYVPSITLDAPPPPISQWAEDTWAAPEAWSPQTWDPAPACPDGTIQSYGGNGCVEFTVPRK